MFSRALILSAIFYAGVAECHAQDASGAAAEEDVVAELQERVRELTRAVADLQAQVRATGADGDASAHVDSGASPGSRPADQQGRAPEPSPVAERPGSLSGGAQIAGQQPAPNILPERRTVRDLLTGVARADAAAPPNNPALRGFIDIPGTQAQVRMGGFAKINAIYDTSPAGNRDSFVTSSIPVGAGGATPLLLGLGLNHSQKANAVARATPERKLAASLS